MSQRVPAATKNVPELFVERVNEPLGRLVKTTLDTKGVERFCECEERKMSVLRLWSSFLIPIAFRHDHVFIVLLRTFSENLHCFNFLKNCFANLMSDKHSISMHFGALKNKNMFKMAQAGLLSHTPPNKWAWCMLTVSGLNSLNMYLDNSICIYCSYIHRYIITFWCLFKKTVKYRRSQDQEDGSEGKDTCPQAWVPSLNLWNHIKVEGVRWIHKTVLWPLHKCHGLYSDTIVAMVVVDDDVFQIIREVITYIFFLTLLPSCYNIEPLIPGVPALYHEMPYVFPGNLWNKGCRYILAAGKDCFQAWNTSYKRWARRKLMSSVGKHN